MKITDLNLTNANGRPFKATIYQQRPNEMLRQPDRPLMLVIPGGSFNHFSVRESEPVALAYAARGFNCAILWYNLVQDEGMVYPDAALSGLQLLTYLRQHHAEYNLDPHRTAVIGFSAGGHVAAMMNSFAQNQQYQEKYQLDPNQCQPEATILGYPLIDIEEIGFELDEQQEASLPSDDFIRDASLGVTPQTPPTFIFQAWDDPVVLIDNGLKYAQALREHNVPAEVHLFDRGGHGFSLAQSELVQTDKPWQDNPHAAHWFELSIEWLQRVFV
ncbi:MAG: alpha/beta hydrolase [Lactobacillus sp.]|jgi:acetyl esterase/lipase|nr:alpha/beta hydrolase [Lactobacillus sp.]MCH3905746.1 alpha/beta hydrolase [Lactobacillus sp.]MCH3990685.1 alpha/beta hydrolase [Lactobacillus sp.]MCH4068599.1 alpha/beta hydrolase [Lactobacillus sp.]MCI1304106.1 alpha/beta hydrolase [Lactobacillus sp.]